MNRFTKVVLLQLWFLIVVPILGWVLYQALGLLGLFLHYFLFGIWCWGIFAYFHYRSCRQEELLYVLQAAATTQSPVERVLRAYLQDRSREHFYRGFLLAFVFPGYYWIHLKRQFDARLRQLADLLESGIPLPQALQAIPGLVAREVALAVMVGQFSGKLSQALRNLTDRGRMTQWLELMPRLLYPFLLLWNLMIIAMFLTIFIIPKYEKIYFDMRLKLPESTEEFIVVSRWLLYYGWALPLIWLLLLILFNVVVLSSRVRWYVPVLGGIERMVQRGQFLRILGLILETGKPLPMILERVLDSGLLVNAVKKRVARLTADLDQGQPLEESLARHGLIKRSMRGLIAASEKAQNLSWILQELGDSQIRASVRLSQRLTMVLLPLGIFLCAILIGAVAIAVFSPLLGLIEGIHG